MAPTALRRATFQRRYRMQTATMQFYLSAVRGASSCPSLLLLPQFFCPPPLGALADPSPRRPLQYPMLWRKSILLTPGIKDISLQRISKANRLSLLQVQLFLKSKQNTHACKGDVFMSVI